MPVLTSTSGGSWPDARAACSSRDLKRSLIVSVVWVGALVDVIFGGGVGVVCLFELMNLIGIEDELYNVY